MFNGWQNGFHDERIRDRAQRSAAYRYIIENPLKHGLVEDIEHWRWTSLHLPNMVNHYEW
jgi:hypothetical protein